MPTKQNQTVGISLENCSGWTVRGNVSVGHDVGIDAKGSHDIAYLDNVSVAPDAVVLFADLAAAIQASSLDLKAKERLAQHIDAMRESAKSPRFIEEYKSFMAVLADHMQVLSPVVAPFFPALAALL